jgi:hypothetical protein
MRRFAQESILQREHLSPQRAQLQRAPHRRRQPALFHRLDEIPYSRLTSREFLSSRRPMNLVCRRGLSPVHSNRTRAARSVFTCRWRIAHFAAVTPEPTRHCGDPPQSKIHILAKVSVRDKDARGFDRSTTREVLASPASHTRSCCDRRLIQPTTVGLPAIRTDTRSCTALACARFRRQPRPFPRACDDS